MVFENDIYLVRVSNVKTRIFPCELKDGTSKRTFPAFQYWEPAFLIPKVFIIKVNETKDEPNFKSWYDKFHSSDIDFCRKHLKFTSDKPLNPNDYAKEMYDFYFDYHLEYDSPLKIIGYIK